MTNDRKLKAAVAVIAFMFFGLTYDIDYCRFTAESTACYRVWGIRVPWTTTHDDGFRSWLEHDVGASFPQEYVDYLNFHPLLSVSSTPPGNWLFLSSMKSTYDVHPEIRDAISHLLIEASARRPPLVSSEDNAMLNGLIERLESKAGSFSQAQNK